MKYLVEDKIYNVEIIRKNNKNTYIRVKEDLTIQITTSYFVSKVSIKEILDQNIEYLKKVLNKRCKQLENEVDFYYLGNRYDIIWISTIEHVDIVDNKIYAKDQKELDKWLKEQTKKIIEERVLYQYNRFEENIPLPSVKIRTMKTRWGVCNRKNKTITLNAKLIRMNPEYLDYVIIHELSHFVNFDHSLNFWKCVEKYNKNYKKIRKNMRD